MTSASGPAMRFTRSTYGGMETTTVGAADAHPIRRRISGLAMRRVTAPKPTTMANELTNINSPFRIGRATVTRDGLLAMPLTQLVASVLSIRPQGRRASASLEKVAWFSSPTLMR